jgi:hypothetical protein
MGRNGPCLCLCRRGGLLFPCQTPTFSLHSTPPRLRTGESMHLVYFWPSPTSWRGGNANCGHLQCSGGSERSVSLFVQKGWKIISMSNAPILATFDTTPSPHGRINAPSLLLAFAHILARRERQLWPSTVQWWVGTVRVFVCAEDGVDYYFHVKHPHSRYIRHHPVSARANQCT